MRGRGGGGWAEALALHADAVAEFARAAEAVRPEDWSSPRAEGKWTPGQIVEHLNLTYDILLQELAGGAGMEVRTKPWQRLLLRWTLVPRLLRGRPFPEGARAPREVRPGDRSPEQREAMAGFWDRAARFEAAVEEVRAERPDARLTHAYFGSAPLEDGVLLCARHIQHHHKQLPAG